MQCLTRIHMVSRAEVVMYRTSLSMLILAVASLASGIPAIASAEDLPPLHERSADVRAGQRLKLVPSLRLDEIPVRAPGPVRAFGPATPDDVGLGQAVLRGGGVLDADGPSQPRGRPSWQAIGSVTLPWRHVRLIVGYGPDGSFSLML
jgi:hypothetical protein